MSLVKDRNGLVHDILDVHGTFCGLVHQAMMTAEAGEVVTCFQCMHPDIVKDCGHRDAEVRNCPYAMEIHGDTEQRCKCCSDCSHQCAMDV